MECSIILSEYANIRVTYLGKVVVKSGNGNPFSMLKKL